MNIAKKLEALEDYQFIYIPHGDLRRLEGGVFGTIEDIADQQNDGTLALLVDGDTLDELFRSGKIDEQQRNEIISRMRGSESVYLIKRGRIFHLFNDELDAAKAMLPDCEIYEIEDLVDKIKNGRDLDDIDLDLVEKVATYLVDGMPLADFLSDSRFVGDVGDRLSKTVSVTDIPFVFYTDSDGYIGASAIGDFAALGSDEESAFTYLERVGLGKLADKEEELFIEYLRNENQRDESFDYVETAEKYAKTRFGRYSQALIESIDYFWERALRAESYV